MNNSKVIIVVDANVLLSALLGGKARSILLSDKFEFITAEYTTWEVKKYIPVLSERTGVSEKELLFVLNHLPITALQPIEYDEKRMNAENLIGHRDPKDVDILALTLKLDAPIWSEDKDFEQIEGIELFKTYDMLNKLTKFVNE